MPLTDQRRKQLDGIVSQMVANNESDINIQTVVNDFKSRYDEKSQDKRSILQKASDASKAAFGVPIGIAKSVLQLPQKAAQFGQDAGISIAAKLRNVPKASIEQALSRTGSGAIMDSATQNINAYEPKSNTERAGVVIGQVGQAFLPTGAATALPKAASALKLGPTIAKAVAPIAKIGGLALEGGGMAGIQSGSASEAAKGATMSALLGIGGKALTSGAKKLSPKLVNSFFGSALKNKDIAYGQNPGRTITELGITARSAADLADELSAATEGLTSELNSTISKYSRTKTSDISNFTEALDQALNNANRAKKTNAPVIARLQNAKDDLISFVGDADLSKASPETIVGLKRLVGDLTKFTGAPSDDAVVNKALKGVYGKLKQNLNDAVPESKKLSEQLSDLISAKNALKAKESKDLKSALMSFPIKTGLANTLLSGGINIPSILLGVGAQAVENALSSAAVRTHLAKWMSKAPIADKRALYIAAPAVYRALSSAFGDKDADLIIKSEESQ